MDGSKTTEIAQARNITALTLDPYKDTVYWANSKQIYAASINGNNRYVKMIHDVYMYCLG